MKLFKSAFSLALALFAATAALAAPGDITGLIQKNGANNPVPKTITGVAAGEVLKMTSTGAAASLNIGWVDVRDYGAIADDAIDDTDEIQAAIDAAILAKTKVVFPAGVYLAAPDAWANWVFLLGYGSYDQTSGLLSSTHPTVPYQETPGYGSLLLEGADTGERLARIDTAPHQTYNKGAVIKFTGSMAGKLGFQTGHWQSNIRFKNLTLVGTGKEIASIGVRHNVGSTHFSMENCHLIHWGTAVDIGGDFASFADTHADYNSFTNLTVTHSDIGVKVNNANAYITELLNCDIAARIPVSNAIGSVGTVPSPRVNITGGFLAPLTEYNGVLVTGTVSSVSGQDIVIGSLTKTTKGRDASFVLSATTGAATMADVTTSMWAIVEKNCNATGATRMPEWGVLNKITAVNAGASTITVTGTVDITSIVGQPIYCVLPAIALYGDHFNLDGTHIEATEAEDFGFGPMLAYLSGWRSETTWHAVTVNLFSVDSPFNRAQPKIYHKNFYAFHSFPLEIDNSTLNISFPKLEVSSSMGVRFRQNSWKNQPLILDHNGIVADGVVREGDSQFLKLRTYFGGGGAEYLALVQQQGKDRYEQLGGLSKRPFRAAASAPTTGTTGEVVAVDGTPTTVWRIGTTSSIAGYYDATALSAVTATIVTATDATLATVNDLTGLYIGRVISIAGAGPAAAALVTRIVDLKVDVTGATKQIWLFNAATTDVTTSAISAVAPTIGNDHGFDTAIINTYFGIGAAGSAAIPLRLSAADGASRAVFNGGTKGWRMGFNGSAALLEAVDNTGVASFQPGRLGGSTLSFDIGGTQKAAINASGDLGLVSTTDSTSPATGAFVVPGGAGIGEDLNVGGAATADTVIATTGFSGDGSNVTNVAASNISGTFGSISMTGDMVRDGILTLTPNALTNDASIEIDVTKGNNTITADSNETFVFSATPATGSLFGLRITPDTVDRTHTISSVYSYNQRAAITTFVQRANKPIQLIFQRLASSYEVFGDPLEDVGEIAFHIDGGGSAIATGTQKIKVVVPFACTITGVTVLADTSTTTTCDIWKDTYANYPPTIADTIVAAAKPTLTAAIKSQNAITSWTTSVAAGDIFYISVDTNNNATVLDVILSTTR